MTNQLVDYIRNQRDEYEYSRATLARFIDRRPHLRIPSLRKDLAWLNDRIAELDRTLKVIDPAERPTL